MLSLHYPEIVSFLTGAGPGLWPVRTKENALALAMKGGGDLAFAAKHKKSLKLHFYRLDVGSSSAVGIITAIYDRANAPAIIMTVCVDEVMRSVMAELASTKTMGIHFFDLHNSELAGGQWSLTPNDEARYLFRSCHADLSHGNILEFYVALQQRFSNPNDDGLVVEAVLVEECVPEDIAIFHITEEAVLSRNSEGLGLYTSSLSRDESPGAANEAEIARLLMNIYPAENLVVNPEISKGKEFCDVLAVGTPEAISVQAKATMRDIGRFEEATARRDARIEKHFHKALDQAKGAERAFYQLNKTVTFKNETLALTPNTKLLIYVLMLYDKTSNLLEGWSKKTAEFSSEQTPVIVLDMSEFVNLVNTNGSRDLFIAGLMPIAEDFEKRKTIGSDTFRKGRLAVH